MMRRSSAKSSSLWQNYDYLLLTGGQAISTIGSGMSYLALPLLVLAFSHSPELAGLIGAIRGLPYLLFSLPAGTLIDRWNRKLLMVICDAGRAIAMGSIVISLMLHILSTQQLMVVAFIEGTLFVFFDLAQVACLPKVVSEHQIAEAYAQNQAVSSLGTLIAPALGGALYSMARALPFGIDALSYGFSVFSLFLIKAPFQERHEGEHPPLLQSIQEGIRWLSRQPLLRFIAIITGINNLAFAGADLLLILLLQQQHASAAVIGLVFAFSSIGGIVGGILGGYVEKKLGFSWILIGTMWGTSALWLCYLIASSPIAVAIFAAAIFFLTILYNTAVVSYRLRLIPDRLQGRVNSIYRLITYGTLPLGLYLSGWLAQTLGVARTFFIVGLILGGLALWTTLNRYVRTATS